MEAPIARGNRGEEETSRREVVRSTRTILFSKRREPDAVLGRG